MKAGSVYFIGIGGIGMSALARYFMREGRRVGGYDRTKTLLTDSLAKEGADIHYDDDPELIGNAFRDPATTLVVYTPAVPADHAELAWFRGEGFEVLKRSEILGHISEGKYVMAVAGTHGKTTTTTMVAWLNHVAAGGGSAFLGGISKNFSTNFVTGDGRRLAVEADEFDRSFLRLHPDVAVITSADADHLDIYGTHENLKEAFAQFVRQIKPGGALIMHTGTNVKADNPDIKMYSYSLDDSGADFYARNIELTETHRYRFDIVCPDRVIGDCTLGVPGKINIENAVAAAAMLWVAGFDEKKLKEGLATFQGVRRRFDMRIDTPQLVYMDDYAHHPEELRAVITSVKEMYPGRRLTVVFQPHLYTRTRDFHREFAASLSLADEVVLVPIYPAREEPIEGVSSQIIGDLLKVPYRTVPKERIAQELEKSAIDVLLTTGAGDIENYCAEIEQRLRQKI